jgi:hypothetical protein
MKIIEEYSEKWHRFISYKKEYRKLQIQLPKILWSAHGDSWIAGWVYAELHNTLKTKQKRNKMYTGICKLQSVL